MFAAHEDNGGENKQKKCIGSLSGGIHLAGSYHSHYLQVLQICPLCGQQLLGNEVGLVSGEPLPSK